MKAGGVVLVVDDEAFVRESLAEVLSASGFDALTAVGADEALRALEQNAVDVVVTDLRMPQGDGHALLKALRTEGRPLPIIVLTGAGTVTDAVAAMKEGAYDFLEKPAEPERLVRIVRNAAERSALVREVRGLREALRLPAEGRRWLGTSPASERVREAIEQAARSDSPVLVLGESGVGKEVVCEEIHRKSERANGPFVRVDCAAADAESLPIVLFGHKKGAVPGNKRERVGRVALAHRGSLYFDEVSSLGLEMQGRLLGLLERGTYERLGDERPMRSDLRVLATSNADLKALVAEGRFREDLLWRLQGLPIAVPALAQRRGDLPALADSLLSELVGARPGTRRGQGETPKLTPEALGLLEAYPWPGNGRELGSVLERALLSAAGATIDESDVADALAPGLGLGRGERATPLPETEDLAIRSNTTRLERRLILRALARTRGRRTEAAGLLGIDSRNFGYYLRKHRIGDDEIERVVEG